MKRLIFTFTLVAIMATSIFSQKRIALLHDGNSHDNDDIGAIAMALAIVKRGEDKGDAVLVHCSYNNHHWANHEPSRGFTATSQYNTMTTSGKQGQTKLFPGQAGIFFDAYANTNASVTHLKNEINASGPGNLLYIATGGPQDQLYLALNAAQASKRKYVRIISHSQWNNKHADAGKKNMKAIQSLLGSDWNVCYKNAGAGVSNVTWKKGNIPNQNDIIWHKTSTKNDFNWLDGESRYQLDWVHNRIKASKEWDVSDAGIAFWIITGNKNPNWNQVKTYFFGNTGGGGDVTITVTNKKADCTGAGKTRNRVWLTVTGSSAKPTTNKGTMVDKGSGKWMLKHMNAAKGSVQTYNFSVGNVSESETVTTVSSCAKAAVNATDNTVSIYPNPATSVLNVELANVSEDARVELYNSTGQLVKVATLENARGSISLSGLNKGIYVIQIHTSQQKFVDRVIVE